jgi:plasmid stabilization system protein ParE
LKPRRVRFTATAQRHVGHEKTWWLDNRLHIDVFATELEDVVRMLSLLPGAGTPYARAGLPGLRRLYLRRIDCHVYYTFDTHTAIVRAVWGARRDRHPSFKS